MKILVVSSYLPYPLYSGGQVRLYNLLKELSVRHEIVLVCESRPNETDSDVKEVEKICREVITVPRRRQWSLENVLKAGISKKSFLTTGHHLPEMTKKIEEVVARENFDVIHVETFYIMQNLPRFPIRPGETDKRMPIVLVEHNIEYKVYEKFKNRAPLPLRPLLGIDINKIRKEEEALWHRADALVAVSNEDKRVMEENGRHPFLVSNGVNTNQFTYKDVKKSLAQKEKKLLFIGDFKWIQNQDSVKFIINEIFPLLKEQLMRHFSKPAVRVHPESLLVRDPGPATSAGRQVRMTVNDANVKLWIVGRQIPDAIRSLSNNPDVLFDQESSARDTHELFQEAAVLLAPIRVGGGTSYKILESMSCGTPVVTMELSANAIEAKDEHDIMVGKTPEELAQKTIQLLTDDALYEKISKNGRALIEKNYTWKAIAKKLEEVYEKVRSER